MSKEWDRQNTGTLFKNDKQGKASRPDYNGSINVDGRDYWLSAWIKDGAKGKFMSLALKPKDAQPEGHPDRFRQAQSAHDDGGSMGGSRQRPTGFPERPRPVREEDLSDDLPF